ncbi:MAG: hypothetical protein CVU89_02450 [Firmicutes bacterium HGW-Firmicutes-14]|nr:MAG: hypothetical protein CVU89_02450 [Firmicutes bacterium HGW-Firmicutes-14]
MTEQEIKIPTDGRPIEASVMHQEEKPGKAFLVLPGRGYTVNHFLLDYLWRMAAESGFYSVKAEYRGYTYRYMGEPYDHKTTGIDTGYILDYLEDTGYGPQDITVCAKSLGTMALAMLLLNRDITFNRAVLLTPVLYYNTEKEIIPVWDNYKAKVRKSYLVFGSDDPYCDPETAGMVFPDELISFYEGFDHGLQMDGNYRRTIEVNSEIIEKVKDFICG